MAGQFLPHSHLYLPICKQAVADVIIELEMTSNQGGTEVNNHAARVNHDNAEKHAHERSLSIRVFLVEIVYMEVVRLRQYHS